MADIIPQTVLNKVRQDKFVLVIDTPNILKDWETNSVRSEKLVNRDKMQFSVVGINIPAHNIQPVGVPFRGQTPHVTSQTRDEYPPVRIDFTIDNNFDNYWYLWKWQSILNHPRKSVMDKHFAEFKNLDDMRLNKVKDVVDNMRKKSNLKPITYKEIRMINNYHDYQTNITLFGLREYNEKIIKFNYYNAFITTLGEIQYDYRLTEEIGCYFSFSYSQIDIELVDPL